MLEDFAIKQTADPLFPCQEKDSPLIWEYLAHTEHSSWFLLRSGAKPVTLLTLSAVRADGAKCSEVLRLCLLHYPELHVSFLCLTFRRKSKVVLETS